MDELMKHTELTRSLIENKKTNNPNESLLKNISYAEALRLFELQGNHY